MTPAVPSVLERLNQFAQACWNDRRQRRWPHHWFAILDNGRRSQDLWTPADWTLWDQALRGVPNLDQPLPEQAPMVGLGWHAQQRQQRYASMNLAGYTPLALALRLRDPAPFQALIDAGANPRSVGTPEGQSPLDVLVELDDAFRCRRWTRTAGGAAPQPWHALLLHRLQEPAPARTRTFGR